MAPSDHFRGVTKMIGLGKDADNLLTVRWRNQMRQFIHNYVLCRHGLLVIQQTLASHGNGLV